MSTDILLLTVAHEVPSRIIYANCVLQNLRANVCIINHHSQCEHVVEIELKTVPIHRSHKWTRNLGWANRSYQVTYQENARWSLGCVGICVLSLVIYKFVRFNIYQSQSNLRREIRLKNDVLLTWAGRQFSISQLKPLCDSGESSTAMATRCTCVTVGELFGRHTKTGERE